MKYKENLTKEWRAAFLALDGALREEARALIAANNFSQDIVAQVHSAVMREVLRYYQILKLRRSKIYANNGAIKNEAFSCFHSAQPRSRIPRKISKYSAYE